MSKIRVLPVDIRNKIAAGEVIERPASVVKELIENSIDADSTEIILDVLYGGKRLIRVTDNGSGMDKDDARLCLERHATSKLANEDDLFNIRTLGFRGEALPAIASVSRIRLTTGLRNAPSGIHIDINGGEIIEVKDAPSHGTSVEVKDLFFNIPARKKFLKTDQTETYHIIDSITKEALSHYIVGFRLTIDNHETMVLSPASGYRERIMQVFGEDLLKGLLGIEAESGNMKIHAFVSSSGNFRNSKSHQYLFINSRPFRDTALSHAIYKSLEGIIPPDKHPIFFVFLEMDPQKVDFNVHPTKREVRFEEKDAVYRFVSSRIRETVRKERNDTVREFSEVPDTNSFSQDYSGTCFAQGPQKEAEEFTVAENTEIGFRPSIPFIYLGDTFIAMAGKGGLTLIDHHAAHERILYEKLLKKVSLEPKSLLFPEQIRLSQKEYRVILENRELLIDLGLDIDDFGHNTIIVRAIPERLEGSNLRGILADVAQALLEGASPSKSIKESIAARIACHASVRGKEILNRDEFERLISDLNSADNPDQCPHGRPTRLFYSLDDLKKLFRRK